MEANTGSPVIESESQCVSPNVAERNQEADEIPDDTVISEQVLSHDKTQTQPQTQVQSVADDVGSIQEIILIGQGSQGE